jgi:glycine C-acetyltransferase
MPSDRIEKLLADELTLLAHSGARKGQEAVVTKILPATSEYGPRVLIEGEGERPFLRMNSNSYLGLSLHPEVIAAEEQASREFGVGPGAVRFISGTYASHRELEQRLAAFHGRQACLLFSAAYAAVLGTLPSLMTENTVVISDALNHNCIINALRLAKPREKYVYRHLDLAELDDQLKRAAQSCDRAIIVTDGIFSMRGDHAPLDRIVQIARDYDQQFAENVLIVIDDSHGVGAFGKTGRGTEEYTAARSDVLIATLGKTLGVNGGYAVGSRTIIEYLREKASTYIYSNPITPGEAAAASKAIAILDSPVGLARLDHLRHMTARFRQGLTELGYETLPGEHPIVPLLVGDTGRTHALEAHLRAQGVLVTGLSFPVVPRGDEEIRFQVSADHTSLDIDQVLVALAQLKG